MFYAKNTHQINTAVSHFAALDWNDQSQFERYYVHDLLGQDQKFQRWQNQKDLITVFMQSADDIEIVTGDGSQGLQTSLVTYIVQWIAGKKITLINFAENKNLISELRRDALQNWQHREAFQNHFVDFLIQQRRLDYLAAQFVTACNNRPGLLSALTDTRSKSPAAAMEQFKQAVEASLYFWFSMLLDMLFDIIIAQAVAHALKNINDYEPIHPAFELQHRSDGFADILSEFGLLPSPTPDHEPDTDEAEYKPPRWF